ncbi:MAG: transposase [Gammaproteobacteria bacterium]|nr:transposase [Gammaproteobacteria bacterium]
MENDPLKPPMWPNPESLFRYTLVSLVLNHEHQGLVRSEAIEKVASQRHIDLEGKYRTVSMRTLYRRLAAFAQGGPDALIPATRKGAAVVLSEELLDFFREQKQSDPRTSVPELIRRADASGRIAADQKIDRTTVWRALKRMGLPTNRVKSPKVRDCRRFAYSHRLDMVLCDGKHFRAGAGRHKRVALFFLDDATRFGLEVVVGTSENTALFLRGLYLCILHYGLMIRLFVDNGAGFTALDSIAVARKLLIHLIHGSVGYPEGHGKIERFNRTALEQVLRLLPGNPEIDPDTQALELRLRHFLHQCYNHTPHESLDGATPWQRFHQDSRPLRFHDHTEQLRQAFVLHQRRRVSRDHIVQVDGVAYETPLGFRGQEIELYRHLLDGSVSIIHEGHLVQLVGVDLQANANDRRARGQDESSTSTPPAGAAQIAFDQDYRPVVDAEGGLSGNPKSKIEEKD